MLVLQFNISIHMESWTSQCIWDRFSVDGQNQVQSLLNKILQTLDSTLHITIIKTQVLVTT